MPTGIEATLGLHGRGIGNLLRRAATQARRIAAICTAGFVLDEAGLLDGRRATTHWAFAQELRNRYPGIEVEEDRIYVIDGPVWTSAGNTAGLDLALAMVAKDLGADVARSVAHELVMHQRRSGGRRSTPRCWSSRPSRTVCRTPSIAHART